MTSSARDLGDPILSPLDAAAGECTNQTPHDDLPTAPVPLALPPPPLPPNRSARGSQPPHRATTTPPVPPQRVPPPIPPQALRPRRDALQPVTPTAVPTRPARRDRHLPLVLVNVVLVAFILGLVVGWAASSRTGSAGAVPCAR